MKRFLTTIVLLVALVVISGQSNRADAYELHVGSLNDGRMVYLVTESIRLVSSASFECDTVARGYSTEYISYMFWRSRNGVFYTNTRGYTRKASESNIARNILNYVRNTMAVDM